MDKLLGYWQTPPGQPDIRLLVRAINATDGFKLLIIIHGRFDPSGNIVEHYSDGDLVNNKTAVAKEPAAQDTMAVWGPNVTLAFLTTRMEDIEKGAAAPVVEQAAVAS